MPHSYTEFTGFYSTSIKADCFRNCVLRQCKIAQFCFLVEFPIAHVHLEDRPCPCLWEHSDRQTRRANPSHCSSYGIFNKRGKSPEYKCTGDFSVPCSLAAWFSPKSASQITHGFCPVMEKKAAELQAVTFVSQYKCVST